MRTCLPRLFFVFPILLIASAASAQGSFTNFETPQTHPIDVATVGGADYVLVCNTPDNSIEIYQAASPFGFVKRIPVGLGPGTVRWFPALGRFYSCNVDGDSVTVVRLDGEGASVTNPVVERTVAVGDEPGDLALSPGLSEVVITLGTQSRAAWLKSVLLNPVDPLNPTFLLDAPYTIPAGNPDSRTPSSQAVKAPRQIAWLDNANDSLDGLFVLNLRGGGPAVTGEYDLGLWRLNPGDPSSSSASRTVLGTLGTTNHAFAVTSTGTRMFVVGTKAKNHGNEGIAVVRDLKTGFVQSWMMVVNIDPATGVMTVAPQASSGFSSPTFRSINLNRNYLFGNLVEVATGSALVQPTDVLLIESGGSVSKIVITAYHSDRVAILTPNSSTSGGYTIQRIAIPVAAGYSVAGPRGLARSSATGFVYVNSRLDNRLHVINPTTATLVQSIALSVDPTPLVIREGRKFLYSNRFSINDSVTPNTGGMVACASCHVDARTDGLAWDLGESVAGPGIASEFHDLENAPLLQFNSDKGRMMTQSLQGLINYPLNETMQFASTNAPYYWRGFRRGPDTPGEPFKELTESFDDFNEAFVALQKMDDIDPDPAVVRGITADDMRKYRLFINTIAVPPNPEQPHTRLTEGPLGSDPNRPNPLPEDFPNPSDNPEAKLGMILYHNFVAVNGLVGRSCVDCHTLPDGSSSTGTLTFPGVNLAGTAEKVGLLPLGNPNSGQIFETAGLRNLAQREMWLHDDFGDIPTKLLGNTGLLHPGTRFFDNAVNGQSPFESSSDPDVIVGGSRAQSVNSFNMVFAGIMPGTSDAEQEAQMRAITEFVRQLDTGIGPAAGVAYTVDPALVPLDSGANQAAFDLLEGQVREGNIGLAVYARKPGAVVGFWFDITVNPPGYRIEGSNDAPTSRLNMLEYALSGGVAIAQATPLGSERRWASANGTATILTGEAPSAVALLPMVPNTAYVDIPLLTGNLNPQVLSSSDPLVLNSTIWALRTLQTAVAGQFGVPTALRHEPPRRFRVTGSKIRPGAKLILTMSDALRNAFEDMEMDLFPVRTSSNALVWETLVELDAMHTFALLNGGFLNEEVQATLLRTDSTPSLNPTVWNAFSVSVVNEDLTASTPVMQALSIQDAR